MNRAMQTEKTNGKRRRDWQTILAESTALRHALHRRPELAWQEEKTAGIIRGRLDELAISWRPCAGLGTVATLGGRAAGPRLALRADMDAMPINEQAAVEYRSRVEGCMHACGHDGHTATLLAAGAWFKLHEEQLAGPVSLIFQPAEEGGHGAERMIDDGALEGVDVIYGWHNWPAIAYGQAVCPDGPVMSGNGTFRVTLQGRGGHASQPEVCRDPVLAAAAVTLNLQQIVSRRLEPQAAAVVSVTSIDAVSSPMVTPDRVLLDGSIRLARPHLRGEINGLIEQITRDTARAYGVEAEIVIKPRYEATVNHAGAAGEYRQALALEFGPDWRMDSLPLPIMASEDFSCYLAERPGAFALIGNAGEEAFGHPCHSPFYQFNDDLLQSVTRVFARLVGAPVP